MRTVTITLADDRWQVIRDDSPYEGLPTLQAAVGGWVEHTTIGPGVSMWSNEEGKLIGLPANPIATALARHADALIGGDQIVGPVIVTGDDDGEVADLPDWFGPHLDRVLTSLGDAASGPVDTDEAPPAPFATVIGSKRKAWFASPNQRTDDGAYIACLATEGETTFEVAAGNGEHAAPWTLGRTFDDAMAAAALWNERDFGLTPDAAASVVLTAMSHLQFPTWTLWVRRIHDLLNDELGVTAYGWADSAGSYLRIAIDPPGCDWPSSYLQSTLSVDGDGPQWTAFAWCGDDDELIATVELPVRPFGHQGDRAATPNEMATAIADLVTRFRNRGLATR